MKDSVLIEPADPRDLELDDFGDPFCALLQVGSYIVGDPSVILKNHGYAEWIKLAKISETPFGQYGYGHDGMIRSARINGYSINGFTVYSDAAEYTDSLGNVYESDWGDNTHTVLAVFPTVLLDELGIEYSKDHVFEITDEDVSKEFNAVHYSTRTHRFFVGITIEIYTGWLGGAEDELDAEQREYEELYEELDD